MPDLHVGGELADKLGVPGDVALRGRFHLITGFMEPDLPAEQFHVDWQKWQFQVKETLLLDQALIVHNPSKARLHANNLIDSVDEIDHPLPMVDGLIGLGDAERQDDRLEMAITHLGEAKDTAKDCGYRFGEARALVSLGYVTMSVRSLSEAVAVFEQAADICRQIDERMYLANALIGLGEANGRLRNIEAAEAAFIEGLDLCTAISSQIGILNASQHLGDLYRRQLKLDEAKSHFERAHAVAERTAASIGRINAANGLGGVLLALQETDTASEYYSSALEVAQQCGFRRGVAHAQNGMGKVAQVNGEWDQAQRYHLAAFTAFNELGDLPSAASTLTYLANLCAAVGDLPLAATCHLAAVDAIEQMRAVQSKHEYQLEYGERFARVYSNAIRSALVAKDVNAFVAAFEGIGGRRLAGMLSALPADLVSEINLVSGLTAATTHGPWLETAASDEPHHMRLARMLGRTAIRDELPAAVERALDDLAATLYSPFDPSTGYVLLESVAKRTNLLLVCQIPDDPSVIAWLRTSGLDDDLCYGTHGLTKETLETLELLNSSGLSPSMTPEFVEPLRSLLPQKALATTADGALTIVPLGRLWAVPWPAVPVEDSMLGAKMALAIAPSLTVAKQAAEREENPIAVAGHWQSPLVKHHRLEALVNDDRVTTYSLGSAIEASKCLRSACHDALIITAHGRPAEGIGHYLELDTDVLVEPSEFLTATPPELLILLACWGANRPGRDAGDPLTLATLALARGSRQVATTTSELADDAITSRHMNQILHRLPEMSLPVAIHQATKRFLEDERTRRGPLSRWAPIITVGTVNRKKDDDFRTPL